MRDPQEKRIPLVECFGPTVQGEGMVIGQQTYFLRFGLCDYKCTKCDSMHAVDPRSVKRFAEFLTQPEIADKLNALQLPNSTNWVTFSGGNPCIHNLNDLIMKLHATNWRISVETQGTFCPDWLDFVDALTISPKGPGMGENTDIKVLDQFVSRVMSAKSPWRKVSFKVVIFDQRDIEFAAAVADRYKGSIPLDDFYLSLGNPNPPDNEGNSDIDEIAHQQLLISQYRLLYEDIAVHPILSKAKFLPQWHVFIWGNAKGH